MSFTPPTGKSFPDFLQFQKDGQNLGGPDVTTVNFTGPGVQATRGTGENAGVLTVQVAGGGGPGPAPGGAPYARFLLSPVSPPAMDGSEFSSWDCYEEYPSDDVVWSNAAGSAVVTRNGLYRVDVRILVESSLEWPAAAMRYGAQFLGHVTPTSYYRPADDLSDPMWPALGWSETAYLDLSIGNDNEYIPFSVSVYAEGSTESTYVAWVDMVVTRVADSMIWGD
jgi:hypothetical protein